MEEVYDKLKQEVTNYIDVLYEHLRYIRQQAWNDLRLKQKEFEVIQFPDRPTEQSMKELQYALQSSYHDRLLHVCRVIEEKEGYIVTLVHALTDLIKLSKTYYNSGKYMESM
jgi:hypothetical protein